MHIDSPNFLAESNKLPKTYLQSLNTHSSSLAQNISPPINTASFEYNDELEAPTDSSNFIPISVEEKYRLYKPWENAVIIKVYGRKVEHQLLRQKVYALWKPTENLPLIDLGSDFFLLKFQKEENKVHALRGGPWFVLNHFLSVRQWEPKFKASETQLTSSAIWLRLPELPTEFYDYHILKKLGQKVGKFLSMDVCTSNTTRGQYARLCVEVLLNQPLKTHLYIGDHKQTILYEGLNLLCITCGCMGHNQRTCPSTGKITPSTDNAKQEQNMSVTRANAQEEWKLVQFPNKYANKRPSRNRQFQSDEVREGQQGKLTPNNLPFRQLAINNEETTVKHNSRLNNMYKQVLPNNKFATLLEESTNENNIILPSTTNDINILGQISNPTQVHKSGVQSNQIVPTTIIPQHYHTLGHATTPHMQTKSQPTTTPSATNDQHSPILNPPPT
uniref:CCHC-type domain-containing protein n=3 Tax=Nicotiana TaxID=4085 RepID=A0A1S3YQR3_TOBAC|nr:PREDICTED: uncharacterized protein LOC104228289 [Nicotiana sylvestris]XP_016454315.1 PREDICTED: uncharacterized protein LOC107778548 [Nicotiana tabacum]